MEQPIPLPLHGGSVEPAMPLSVAPFDRAKRYRPDGTEYWSARELMPLLGYSRWQTFGAAVDRAMSTAQNQGLAVAVEFVQVSQVTRAGNLGAQERLDYELSRYAAYLVAMNGDPRMPAVAAAQSYFAIRTREAEVAAPPRELSFEEKTLEVLSGLTARVEQQRIENERQAQQIEEARPLVARAKTYEANAVDVGRQEFAREICKALREQLGVKVTQNNVHEFNARKLHLFISGDRRDHGHATAHAEKAGLAITEKGTTDEGFNFATGRLTPKGHTYAWERIFAFATEHGHLDLKKGSAA